MLWNAREEAVQCLIEIESGHGYSNLVLDRRIQKYPPSVDLRDKALVTHLVYTVLAHRLTIDTLIDQHAKTPVTKMKPYIRQTLRVACAQMLYDERIPNRAAIHEAVENVKHSKWKGLSGFVNGVLRAIDRDGLGIRYPEDPVEKLSIETSLPTDIIHMWIDSYGVEEARRIAESLSTEPCPSVRCNLLKTDPESLQQELIGMLGPDAVRQSQVLPEIFFLKAAEGLANWPAFQEGRLTVQGESSAIAATLVQAKPGMAVLDMCAAPGGKSAVIAQQMENTGHVVSCDVHDHKIRLIEEGMQRMGITNCEAVLKDGTVFDPAWEAKFDRVLLDAPCSGLGILRSKPDIRWNRTESEYRELVELQRKLLENASRYVKPGGRLVYSTCTIREAENEGQVQDFLDGHPEFHLINPEKDLPTLTICDTIKPNAHAQWPKRPCPNGPEAQIPWKILLPEDHGRDGFFIACMKKQVAEA